MALSNAQFLEQLLLIRDEAVLSGLLTSYTIANRSYSFSSIEQIERLISIYEDKVDRATNGIKVGVVFGRP